jgi:outer membrane lipoprotein-sorting protein
MPRTASAACRASARRFRSSVVAVALLVAGCAIAPPPLRAPIADDARRAVDLLTERFREFHDLRALADVAAKKGSERQHLSGVLLARAPGSVRFEALSPFGQPFLLATVHDGRFVIYNAATNEASVAPATVETAAELLSLPVEPDDLVALLAGLAIPPKDLRVAEMLAADELGPSIDLIGRYHRKRVWMDFTTGVVRRVTIVGGRTDATVTFRRGDDGALTALDVQAANDYVTSTVTYRSLTVNGGVEPERFALALPKDAKIHTIR